jgi:hypothetical protein
MMLRDGWQLATNFADNVAGHFSDVRWRDVFDTYIGDARLIDTTLGDGAGGNVSPKEAVNKAFEALSRDGSDLGFLVRMLHVQWQHEKLAGNFLTCFDGFLQPPPVGIADSITRLVAVFKLDPHPVDAQIVDLLGLAEPLGTLSDRLVTMSQLAQGHAALLSAVVPLRKALDNPLDSELSPEEAFAAALALVRASLSSNAGIQAADQDGSFQQGLARLEAPDEAVGREALLVALVDRLAASIHDRLFVDVRDLPLRPLYDALRALGLYGWRAPLRDLAVALHHRVLVEAWWRRIAALAVPFDGIRDITDTDAFVVGYSRHFGAIFRLIVAYPPFMQTPYAKGYEAIRSARQMLETVQSLPDTDPGRLTRLADVRATLDEQIRAWCADVSDAVPRESGRFAEVARDAALLQADLVAFIARIKTLTREFGP